MRVKVPYIIMRPQLITSLMSHILFHRLSAVKWEPLTFRHNKMAIYRSLFHFVLTAKSLSFAKTPFPLILFSIKFHFPFCKLQKYNFIRYSLTFYQK